MEWRRFEQHALNFPQAVLCVTVLLAQSPYRNGFAAWLWLTGAM